jgi:hypothetical protein
MARRKQKKLIAPVLIWDTVWKILAIRRAAQLKKYRWIPVLLTTSTVGVAPMLFLLTNRGETAPEEA